MARVWNLYTELLDSECERLENERNALVAVNNEKQEKLDRLTPKKKHVL